MFFREYSLRELLASFPGPTKLLQRRGPGNEVNRATCLNILHFFWMCLQARSQTLKKGDANNYYKQGLIWSSLEGNSVQSIFNIGGSEGAPPGKFLTFRNS